MTNAARATATTFASSALSMTLRHGLPIAAAANAQSFGGSAGSIALAPLHQSQVDARQLGTMPGPVSAATDFGRQAAKALLDVCRKNTPTPEPRSPDYFAFAGSTSWANTARTTRRALVFLAELPHEVVDKLDRELTEQTKAALRLAMVAFRADTATLSSFL